MATSLTALTALQVSLHEDIRLLSQKAAHGAAVTAADLLAQSQRAEAIATQVGLALADIDARVTVLENA